MKQQPLDSGLNNAGSADRVWSQKGNLTSLALQSHSYGSDEEGKDAMIVFLA